MRWLLVILCMFPAVIARGEETSPQPKTFPYVAYIAPERARVYAGPGNAYYATDEVSRGQKVEVYREISGWLAIRPVIGSFAWIPAREAELTDEPDVAKVLRDDVPAWIGTRIDREAEPLWQVQLNTGDLVKILDTKRRPAATAGKPAETWYRIEPPAGEFRFIKAEEVTTEELPAEEEPTEEDASEKEVKEGEQPRELPAVAKKAKPLKKENAGEKDVDEESAEKPEAETPESESVLKAQFVARDKDRDAKDKARARASLPLGKASASTSPFKEVGSGMSNRTEPARIASLERLAPTDPAALLSASSRFDDKLGELELQLSILATREPRDWKLDTLRAQAEQLVGGGQTTLERGRARLVLDKIAQFENLAERSQILSDYSRTPGVTTVEETSLPSSDLKEPVVKADGLKLPDGVTYDGVGWLKPVYSAKRVAPPYALVDVDGKVLQYVTPSPGLNLNRYVKKPVGIFGQKSHLAEFKADHLTASKVVELTKYQK